MQVHASHLCARGRPQPGVAQRSGSTRRLGCARREAAYDLTVLTAQAFTARACAGQRSRFSPTCTAQPEQRARSQVRPAALPLSGWSQSSGCATGVPQLEHFVRGAPRVQTKPAPPGRGVQPTDQAPSVPVAGAGSVAGTGSVGAVAAAVGSSFARASAMRARARASDAVGGQLAAGISPPLHRSISSRYGGSGDAPDSQFSQATCVAPTWCAAARTDNPREVRSSRMRR